MKIDINNKDHRDFLLQKLSDEMSISESKVQEAINIIKSIVALQKDMWKIYSIRFDLVKMLNNAYMLGNDISNVLSTKKESFLIAHKKGAKGIVPQNDFERNILMDKDMAPYYRIFNAVKNHINILENHIKTIDRLIYAIDVKLKLEGIRTK